MPSKNKDSFLYILPIGETGAGKTTLINSFANYSQYDTLDVAIEKGPVVLADVGFAASIERNPVYIKGTSKVGAELANTFGMTHTVSSSICTVDSDDSHDVVFYDNPGFGSQSLKQVYVTKKSVHAICIVLKPDETRLHPELRSFLEKLEEALFKNIIFCFTNTRAHNFTTLATLRSFISNLENAQEVGFKIDTKNLFCFENDCFRYLCLLSKSCEEKRPNHRKLSTEYNSNVQEFKRLIDHVKNLSPILIDIDSRGLFTDPNCETAVTSTVSELSEMFALQLPRKEDNEQSKRFVMNSMEQQENSNRPSTSLNKFPIEQSLPVKLITEPNLAVKDEKEHPEKKDASVYNILMFGEAQSGKEQFVNMFLSHLTYKTFKIATFSGLLDLAGMKAGSVDSRPCEDQSCNVSCTKLRKASQNYTLYEIKLESNNKELDRTIRLINVKDIAENTTKEKVEVAVKDVQKFGDIHVAAVFVRLEALPSNIRQHTLDNLQALIPAFLDKILICTYDVDSAYCSQKQLEMSYYSFGSHVFVYAMSSTLASAQWNENATTTQKFLSYLTTMKPIKQSESQSQASLCLQDLLKTISSEKQPTVKFLCDGNSLPVRDRLEMLRVILNPAEMDLVTKLFSLSEDKNSEPENALHQADTKPVLHDPKKRPVFEKPDLKRQIQHWLKITAGAENVVQERVPETAITSQPPLETRAETMEDNARGLSILERTMILSKRVEQIRMDRDKCLHKSDWSLGSYKEERDLLLRALNDVDSDYHQNFSKPFGTVFGNLIFKGVFVNDDQLRRIHALDTAKKTYDDLKCKACRLMDSDEMERLLDTAEQSIEVYAQKVSVLLRQ